MHTDSNIVRVQPFEDGFIAFGRHHSQGRKEGDFESGRFYRGESAEVIKLLLELSKNPQTAR